MVFAHSHHSMIHKSIAHPSISAHQRYQLEVIFLFVAGFFLLFPYYMAIEMLRLDTSMWQWVFFIPWMGFYIWYSLRTRNSVPANERQKPLKRAIGHWVLLGLAILLLHLQPRSLKDLYSFDLGFFIFSLFLADSYWDFRKE